jgi:integrase
MGRHVKLYCLRRRKDTGYWQYKLKGWKDYRTTGTQREDLALKVVLQALERQAGRTGSLHDYASPFFFRESCPRTQHLEGEGKTIGDRHLREQRRVLERHVLSDTLADKALAEITRGDLLAFRARLLQALPGRFRTINKTLAVLKTIFHEAVYREDLRSSPAQGIGATRYPVRKSATLTVKELARLFPHRPPGPWRDMDGYAAFLLAVSTGMRKGEVLAVRWMDIDFDRRLVQVRKAWKDAAQTGPPKGGYERTSPILFCPERMIRVLQVLYASRVAVDPTGLAFCYADGSRLGDTWWAKRWARALQAAKIEAAGRRLTPHGLRRTLNSMLRAAGKDAAKIRAALGWRQEATQDGYTEFRAEDLEDLRL